MCTVTPGSCGTGEEPRTLGALGEDSIECTLLTELQSQYPSFILCPGLPATTTTWLGALGKTQSTATAIIAPSVRFNSIDSGSVLNHLTCCLDEQGFVINALLCTDTEYI